MQEVLYCQTWNQKLLVLPLQKFPTFNKLLKYLSKQLGIPTAFLRLVQANKNIHELSQLKNDYTLSVTLSNGLQGGKGGFGSLLRSMNPKKKQEQNFESCRDLSGRRLRNTLNESRLEEWKKRQEEEEKYVKEENAEYEKNKNNLQKAIHANNFKIDEKYKQQVQNGAKTITESIKLGKQMNQKKREIKQDHKHKKKGLDLDELLKDEN